MPFAVVVAVALPLVLTANPDPRLRAGVALHDAGNLPGAIEVYRAILKDRPNDPATVYELGYSLVSHRDYTAALKLIDDARQSGVPQSPRLFTLQANALLAVGDQPRAEAALRAGLDVEPQNPELHYSLGVNLSTQERWPEAQAEFVAAIERGPEQPSGWWGLGRALEEQGLQVPAALAYARSATLQSEPSRAKAAAERAAKLLDASDAPALARRLSAVEGDGAALELTRPFFAEARAKGHLDAVAYELMRIAGDASAELWRAQNVARMKALYEWAAGFNLRMLREARSRR